MSDKEKQDNNNEQSGPSPGKQVQKESKSNDKDKQIEQQSHQKLSLKREQQSSLMQKEDIEFISDSREATLASKTPFASLVIYVLLAFIIVALIWAKFAVLEEVTVGEGKVIPSSQVKKIQNLEGGILAELLVQEGEIVKKGQMLAKLDDTRFKSEYREGREQYLGFLARIARLTAEVSDKDKVTFPPEVVKNGEEYIKTEIRLFNSRRKAIQENLKTLNRSYELAQNELKITKPLVEQGIVSKIEWYRLERQANQLKGSINEEKNKFQKEAQQDLTETRGKLRRLVEKLRTLQDRMRRTTIRSPVRGIVKQINVNTIGGVIKPGDEIMEVVPLDDTLLVEARIKPKDIAFIAPGQKATVKVTAYDYSIYGGLEGKVTHISADTKTDEKGNSYYEVWVRTDKNALGTKEKPLPIIPGMQVTIHILTGHKSVLDYILKPLLKAKQSALRER
jgi:membrane fusion protein, adhesin transport system